MKLDRKLQQQILCAAADAYPDSIPEGVFNNISSNHDGDIVTANLIYLSEHGLIKEVVQQRMKGFFNAANTQCICTKNGVDFVADDGGLGAILNTVTVKLHEDTLREMIESKILQSDLSKKEKETFVQSLKKLPADSIKHLTMKLLDKGIESSPAILDLISSCLR